MATEIERALVEAKRTDDLSMLLRLLGTTELYAYVERKHFDRAIRRNRIDPALHHRFWRNPRPASPRDLSLFTRGALPDRVDGLVAVRVLTTSLWGGMGRSVDVVINAGDPSEIRITKANAVGALLQRVREQQPQASTKACGHDDRLMAHDDADLDREFLHALGCGGHLAVQNGVPWNELGDVFDDYVGDRESLESSWGVTNATSWTVQLGHLLSGANTRHQLEAVFEARRRLETFDPAGARNPVIWHAYAQETTSLSGDSIAEIIAAALEIEEALVDDGVLDEDEYVPSVLAYDFGRAVSFARWGVGARFATFAEAEEGIRIAGRNARANYHSWRMFSAGYILGRTIRFLDDRHMYTSAVGPHHLLLNTAGSPWRTIDFADPSRL